MMIEKFKFIFDKTRINALFACTIVALTISVLSFIPAITAELPDDPNGDSPASLNDPDIPLIEVVFLLDSTGSMSDEILSVKSHIQNIVEDTISGNPMPMSGYGSLHTATILLRMKHMFIKCST